MEAMAKQEAARQEQGEKSEREKLQAALKKQLEARVRSLFPIGRRSHHNSKPRANRRKRLSTTK
jgi:hypothetical protein